MSKMHNFGKLWCDLGWSWDVLERLYDAGIAESQENEAEKNNNRIVQKNLYLLNSLGISEEQSQFRLAF